MNAIDQIAKVCIASKVFTEAAKAVQSAQSELDYAYGAWRHQTRCEHVFTERGSVLWNQMMLGTKPYYRALQNAKGRKRRAEKKLIAAMGV